MVLIMVISSLICFACACKMGKDVTIAEEERITAAEKSYGVIFGDDRLEDHNIDNGS